MTALREKQKEQRTETILKAAISVMAEKGYHETRISDIATQAGVAYGLVYHYFESKEKILAAIFVSIWQRFGERISRIQKMDLSVVEKLGLVSDYMIDTYIARPDIIQLLVREVVRARHIENLSDLEIVKKILGMFEEIFTDAIRKKELTSGDPALLSIAFFGSMEMTLVALSSGMLGRNPNQIKNLKKKLRTFLAGGSFGRT